MNTEINSRTICNVSFHLSVKVSFFRFGHILCQRIICWKLIDWLEEESIFAEEPAGFMIERSVTNQCLALQHLTKKYIFPPKWGCMWLLLILKQSSVSLQ